MKSDLTWTAAWWGEARTSETHLFSSLSYSVLTQTVQKDSLMMRWAEGCWDTTLFLKNGSLYNSLWCCSDEHTHINLFCFQWKNTPEHYCLSEVFLGWLSSASAAPVIVCCVIMRKTKEGSLRWLRCFLSAFSWFAGIDYFVFSEYWYCVQLNIYVFFMSYAVLSRCEGKSLTEGNMMMVTITTVLMTVFFLSVITMKPLVLTPCTCFMRKSIINVIFDGSSCCCL